MRELHEVKPQPQTVEEILLHGIWEIATLAPGGHLSDPCYGARRQIQDYARRIWRAAEQVTPREGAE